MNFCVISWFLKRARQVYWPASCWVMFVTYSSRPSPDDMGAEYTLRLGQARSGQVWPLRSAAGTVTPVLSHAMKDESVMPEKNEHTSLRSVYASSLSCKCIKAAVSRNAPGRKRKKGG